MRNDFEKALVCDIPGLTFTIIFCILVKALSENVFIKRTLSTPNQVTMRNRPPTIADVARHAEVSIATVSRVLNGTTPVQPEKADRVRLAMDELRFVPRHAARVLASKRTNTIGLVMSEIGGAFSPPMLKGIEAAAHD